MIARLRCVLLSLLLLVSPSNSFRSRVWRGFSAAQHQQLSSARSKTAYDNMMLSQLKMTVGDHSGVEFCREETNVSDVADSNAEQGKGYSFKSCIFQPKEVSIPNKIENVKCIGVPKVIFTGKEWTMWFHGRDSALEDKVSSTVAANGQQKKLVPLNTGRVYCAKSHNGYDHWKLLTDNNPCLSPSKEGGDWFYFDSEHVGIGDIVVAGSQLAAKIGAGTDNQVFLMYTFGGNAEATLETKADGDGNVLEVGTKLEIGVAISQDGVNWSRIEGPSSYCSIIEVGKEKYHPALGLDYPSFDAKLVAWPSVLEVGKDYVMYYQVFDPLRQKFVVARATASDGLLRWKKEGIVFTEGDADAFDAKGITRRHVIRLSDGSFRMYYEGVSATGQHSIGVATSADGVRWQRYGKNPIFSPSSDTNAWDNGNVGSPHVVFDAQTKKFRLYYVGSPADVDPLQFNAIGVADSIDEDGLVFERRPF